LLLGVFVGTIGFLLRSYTITAAAVVFAVMGAAFSLVMLWRAIGRDPEMPQTIKGRLRLHLFLFGPVVALQLLIYNYHPTSSFSGLGGAANASKT
jgi:hypothetical protein